MARVTVEDCITIVSNRFELVLLAAQRARDLSAGVPPTVERDNDKNAVIALREMADQTIDFEELRHHIVHGVNRHEDLNNEDDMLLSLAQEAGFSVEGDLSGMTDMQEVAYEDEAQQQASGEEDAPVATVGEVSPASEDNVDIDGEIGLGGDKKDTNFSAKTGS